MMTWDEQVAVRTLWAECRGEPLNGQRAVAHVLLNRMRDGRWGDNLAAVCLRRKQFSCWNDDDPQRDRMAALPDNDPQLLTMLAILNEARTTADETGNANHYFADTISPPSWAADMKATGKIGHHLFFTDRPGVSVGHPAYSIVNLTEAEIVAETKSPLASKGIWGGVIAIVATVAGSVLGVTITDADQQQIIEIVTAISASVGGLLAIWGRITATKQIGAK